jgi:hypothetical protein
MAGSCTRSKPERVRGHAATLDTDAFGPVLERLEAAGLPVLAGLAALDGFRHAEFRQRGRGRRFRIVCSIGCVRQ